MEKNMDNEIETEVIQGIIDFVDPWNRSFTSLSSFFCLPEKPAFEKSTILLEFCKSCEGRPNYRRSSLDAPDIQSNKGSFLPLL